MPNPTAPAVPSPAPRLSDASVDRGDDEAFFPDEWGSVILPTGLHESRFKPMGGTSTSLFENPLLKLSNTWVEELTAAEQSKIAEYVKRQESLKGLPPTGVLLLGYTIFVPVGFNASEAKISLLFAVGSEIPRDGLRKFLESSSDRVLVLVPGIEGGYSVAAQSIGRPWGIGITKDIIDALFTAAGLVGVPWRVDVVACFSTGYWGFNGTINNCAPAPNVLDLSHVRTVVIYDALYEGTRPNPPGHNTQRVLAAIDKLTSSQVHLVVYEVTGGVPRDAGGETEVPQAWLASTFSGRYALIDLKQHRVGLGALLYARVFQSAVADGYFDEKVLPGALRRLMKALPPRGSVMSPAPQSFLRWSPGKTYLTDWIRSNSADVKAIEAQHDYLLRQYIAARKYNLMGWSPPAFDSVLHDGFLFELGWEFLAG